MAPEGWRNRLDELNGKGLIQAGLRSAQKEVYWVA